VKFCFVGVPASAFLGSTVGFNELNQKSTSGGLGYAKIAIQKKVTYPALPGSLRHPLKRT